MGQGGPYIGCDDRREAAGRRASAAQETVHCIGQVLLAILRAKERAKSVEGALGDGDGLADFADLEIVLDHPQLLDPISARFPVDGRRQLAQRFQLVDRDGRTLEADVATAELGEHFANRGRQLLGRRADVRF